MKHKCEQCGKRIPADRVQNALSRGREPRYCSIECKNRAMSAAHYARKKKAED